MDEKTLDFFDNSALNLEILGEELGETTEQVALTLTDLIQSLSKASRMKSKIVRFGWEDYHPKNRFPNNQQLEEEIGHVLCLVDILIHQKLLTKKGIMAGKKDKLQKMPAYYRRLNDAVHEP